MDLPPNSIQALRKAITQGFSIETDIRFRNGRLVISHDIPKANSVTAGFAELLDLLAELRAGKVKTKVALNIKEDGLGPHLDSIRDIPAFFLFDSSVPELNRLSQQKFRVFRRVSEYEFPLDSLSFPKTSGYWLDGFESDWFLSHDLGTIAEEEFVLVSPELHGRNFMHTWDWFLQNFRDHENAYICTDFPEQFEIFSRSGG